MTAGRAAAGADAGSRLAPQALTRTPSPRSVPSRMLAISEYAGANVVNRDRMWHYTEGIVNWDPIWPDHAIRIIPGPSSLWLDAKGNRLPVPLFPGFDTLGTLQHLMKTGHDYSWFILTQKIIKKEFALSGSEQNPDLTGKSWQQVLDTYGELCDSIWLHRTRTQTPTPIPTCTPTQRHSPTWTLGGQRTRTWGRT